MPDRISLMEMPIDRVTEDEAVSHVGDALGRGEGGWVITPNLDHLRLFRQRRELRAPFDEADLVVADRMPLVWASRLQDTPLPERVAGSNLIWSLSEEASRRDATVYLVGGNDGTAEAAARVLEESTSVRVAGASCPPLGFEHDPDMLESVASEVTSAVPGVVYVGLPLEKQISLIPRLRQHHPSAWCLGLGVSFSFVAGEIRRAPRWMQRGGLEWLHRLSQEPRRLFRRYALEGIPFATALFGHAIGRRLTR